MILLPSIQTIFPWIGLLL